MPQLWRQAVSEVRPDLAKDKLQKKVYEAELAIFARLQELASLPDHTSEHQEIEQATNLLRRIQIEKLNFPDVDGRD